VIDRSVKTARPLTASTAVLPVSVAPFEPVPDDIDAVIVKFQRLWVIVTADRGTPVSGRTRTRG